MLHNYVTKLIFSHSCARENLEFAIFATQETVFMRIFCLTLITLSVMLMCPSCQKQTPHIIINCQIDNVTSANLTVTCTYTIEDTGYPSDYVIGVIVSNKPLSGYFYHGGTLFNYDTFETRHVFFEPDPDTKSYTTSISGLSENTTYYVQGFACSSNVGKFGTAKSCVTPNREFVMVEAVDLGLSVKWSAFNLGATAPEEYGDFFAWGETEPKSKYISKNYIHYDTEDDDRYNWTAKKYNPTDNVLILDNEDDAAYNILGDKWRIPTRNEFNELIEKCTWELTSRHGISGYNVYGPNDNSIFIPLCGVRGASYDSNDEYYYSSQSAYWSRSLHPEQYGTAYCLSIINKISTRTSQRWWGFPIRPVKE